MVSVCVADVCAASGSSSGRELRVPNVPSVSARRQVEVCQSAIGCPRETTASGQQARWVYKTPPTPSPLLDPFRPWLISLFSHMKCEF